MHKTIQFTGILFAFLIFTSHIQAQDNTGFDVRDKLAFGLKIGGNYSNIYDAQGDNFKAEGKVGFVGGAFLAIPIGKFLGIQPELLVSQKGFRGTGRVLLSTYDFTRTTTYIDIPVFLAFKPLEQITFLIGPQYSFLVKQYDVYSGGSITADQQKSFSNDNLRVNTICFVAGVDLNIRHVVIGARAGLDVLNNNEDGSSTAPRYKNVWLQLTVGVRFY
ncbi:MAG: PorT family protein [Cytophagales bacterium]|nr:PorT family protein [Cytophagales bacterium]